MPSLIDRARENLGRRAIGAVVALSIEALLFWALISLGVVELPKKIVPLSLSSFDVRNEIHTAAEHQKKPKDHALARAAASPQLVRAQPVPSQAAPAPQPATIIPLSPQLQSFDLAKLGRSPQPTSKAGPLIGPVATPRFGDSDRVGTAPNGQPMYLAAWYGAPPGHAELDGYMSAANGPGWANIACKTVADFRVKDCVGIDEYPEGSHIMSSYLAATWQFRIRPPRIGGVSQVGDWVFIHFTYELRPAGNPYGDPSRR